MKRIVALFVVTLLVITVLSLPVGAKVFPSECGAPGYAVWAAMVCLAYILADLFTYGNPDNSRPADGDGLSG